VRTGGSYLSLSEPVLTFGLAGSGPAARVTVSWGDGREMTVERAGEGGGITRIGSSQSK
jgi:hypothetical protein